MEHTLWLIHLADRSFMFCPSFCLSCLSIHPPICPPVYPSNITMTNLTWSLFPPPRLLNASRSQKSLIWLSWSARSLNALWSPEGSMRIRPRDKQDGLHFPSCFWNITAKLSFPSSWLSSSRKSGVCTEAKDCSSYLFSNPLQTLLAMRMWRWGRSHVDWTNLCGGCVVVLQDRVMLTTLIGCGMRRFQRG